MALAISLELYIHPAFQTATRDFLKFGEKRRKRLFLHHFFLLFLPCVFSFSYFAMKVKRKWMGRWKWKGNNGNDLCIASTKNLGNLFWGSICVPKLFWKIRLKRIYLQSHKKLALLVLSIVVWGTGIMNLLQMLSCETDFCELFIPMFFSTCFGGFWQTFFNNPLRSNTKTCSEKKEEYNLCDIVTFLQTCCPPPWVIHFHYTKKVTFKQVSHVEFQATDVHIFSPIPFKGILWRYTRIIKRPEWTCGPIYQPPELCSNSWYAPDLHQQYHCCPCGWAPCNSNGHNGQASTTSQIKVSSSSKTAKTASRSVNECLWVPNCY